MALDAFVNFAKVTVSQGYNSAATSIVLSSGNGALLPAVSFNAVWWDATLYTDPTDDPNVEIVRVTNISTDTLTITRAQESTAAANHNTSGHTYKMIAGLTAKTINTDMSAVTNLTKSGTGVIVAGALGINGVTPNASGLDAGQGFLVCRKTAANLSNGLNSNINIGTAGNIDIAGPTAGFSLGGFTGGVDGRVLFVTNLTGQVMTVVNGDASSSAGNKIVTNTGGNIVPGGGQGGLIFIFSAGDNAWSLVGQSHG